MQREVIRPRLGDYDDLAFPEEGPSAKVTRGKAPAFATASSSQPAAKPKKKSKFAQEREAFLLNLDDDEAGAAPPPRAKSLVKDIVERSTSSVSPSFPSFSRPPPTKSEPPGTYGAARKPVVLRPEPEEGSNEALLAAVGTENEAYLASLSPAQLEEEQRSVIEQLGLSSGLLAVLNMRARSRGFEAGQPATAKKDPAGQPIALRREPPVARKNQRSGEMEDQLAEVETEPPVIDDSALFAAASSTVAPSGPAPVARPTWSVSLTGALSQSTNSSLVDPATLHPSATGGTTFSSSADTQLPVASVIALADSPVPGQRMMALLVLLRMMEKLHGSQLAAGEPLGPSVEVEVVDIALRRLADSNVTVVARAVDILLVLFSSSRIIAHVVIKGKGRERTATSASVLVAILPQSLPHLAQRLKYGTLPYESQLAVLRLLVVLARLGVEEVADALAECTGLLEAVSTKFLAVPWPQGPGSASAEAEERQPQELGATLLALLVASSRTRAHDVFTTRKLADPLVKFLAVLPWELPDAAMAEKGWRMLCVTLEVWEKAARYAYGTDALAAQKEVWDAVAERFQSPPPEGNTSALEHEARSRWWTLLALWITAAVDPHTTGHDIVWTQVAGWIDLAFAAHDATLDSPASPTSQLPGIWACMTAWIRGSYVNQPEKGKHELWPRLQGDFAQEGRAWALLETSYASAVLGSDEGARVCLAAARLLDAVDAAPLQPGEERTRRVWERDPQAAQAFLAAHLGPPKDGTPAIEARAFASSLLPLLPAAVRARWSFALLERLQPGEEPIATRVLASLLDSVAEQGTKFANVGVIEPFVAHAVGQVSGRRILAPLHPSPQGLVTAAVQHPFGAKDKLLAPDWPLAPVLEALLRSSPNDEEDGDAAPSVWASLPQDWNVPEPVLVSAGLALLSHLLHEVPPESRPSEATILFDVAKVFLLELGTEGGGAEVYRDEGVDRELRELLQPLRIGGIPQVWAELDKMEEGEGKLEQLSMGRNGTPYFTLYSDLVGLYQAHSMGHDLFAAILLPPLAMHYAIDYRRLVWIDGGPALVRTIRTKVEDVWPDALDQHAISKFLHPAETSETLLMAYASAIATTLNATDQPFLHLVASHHVAMALQRTTPEQEGVRRSIKSILTRGGKEALLEMLLYGHNLSEARPSCSEVKV